MGGSTLTFVAAVRHFYEEVFNKKNVAAIDDLHFTIEEIVAPSPCM
jgi:hypothetical protein